MINLCSLLLHCPIVVTFFFSQVHLTANILEGEVLVMVNGQVEVKLGTCWIQIKCSDLVRLWKIALRGRDTNEERIYKWRLEGSTYGENSTALLELPKPSYIGNELEYYLVDTTDRFNISSACHVHCCRLTLADASTYIGLPARALRQCAY